MLQHLLLAEEDAREIDEDIAEGALPRWRGAPGAHAGQQPALCASPSVLALSRTLPLPTVTHHPQWSADKQIHPIWYLTLP